MADATIRAPMPEASDGADDAGAIVEALRRDGAETTDPVRFRFIEALARRGARLDGEARRLVRARFDQAVEACRGQVVAAAGEGRAPTPASPLALLLGEIESKADGRWMPGGAAGDHAHSGPPSPRDPASPRELKSLRYFREDWSRVGVEQQLARALAQGPRNAGPLNSHGLILQSLQAMRELSPACLERTMAWLDTLLWLDDATAAPAPVAAERPPSRPAAGKAPAKAPAKASRTVRSKAR